MPIQTVLGWIEPHELGRTNMHEHILSDARVWTMPPREEMPADETVTIENLGFLRWNVNSLGDNLVLEDVELAVREVSAIKAAGGSGIVEFTLPGAGRRIREMPDIARRTGLHVMVGCGLYIDETQPEWARSASVDQLAQSMVDDLTTGIEGTDIRAALIGEIGTGDPVSAQEKKVVAAAGRAGVATGAAVNIHLDHRGKHALEVLELLVAEGMTPGRIIFSHMDSDLDEDYHLAVAETGAVLEYDTFGQEDYLGTILKNPTDEERMQYVQMLVEKGYGDQLVFGSDTWTKICLRAYGGMGYDHVIKRIIPALERDYGVSPEVLDRIMVHTPRRLLDRP
jgi:phosphotriesterase-related protein